MRCFTGGDLLPLLRVLALGLYLYVSIVLYLIILYVLYIFINELSAVTSSLFPGSWFRIIFIWLSYMYYICYIYIYGLPAGTSSRFSGSTCGAKGRCFIAAYQYKINFTFQYTIDYIYQYIVDATGPTGGAKGALQSPHSRIATKYHLLFYRCGAEISSFIWFFFW